ncbi:DUF5709 domain-containing protein [Spongiactinospora sp. TRM90649]|uniref:DUF5709 domain-containing protein n=1 Tax=Spongiactinospora sp. TRM90649 TaxID=3031114 RepID=UPI0023F8345D|nr:DUF5709 domain-containing protein [Spongiactinospora sp. TRM90649]MDF5757132.1 DUF5709 domain-containing protein [Spongiactinospora sp. TRM90649]
MTENVPEPDPRSPAEDEGIPDLEGGYPEARWAVDPQEFALPGERPQAVDDFGTTREEQVRGESLDGRLRREVPEPEPVFGRPPGGLEPEGGTVEEREMEADDIAPPDDLPPDANPDAEPPPDPDWDDPVVRPPGMTDDGLSETGGLGVGSDLDTNYEPGPDVDPGWPAHPEEPSGVEEAPRPAGRLVEPDEGVRADTEAEEIAREVGPDSGGFSAEEAAMHIEEE